MLLLGQGRLLESRPAGPGSVRGHRVPCPCGPRAELLPAPAARALAGGGRRLGGGPGLHAWWVEVTPVAHRPRGV